MCLPACVCRGTREAPTLSVCLLFVRPSAHLSSALDTTLQRVALAPPFTHVS